MGECCLALLYPRVIQLLLQVLTELYMERKRVSSGTSTPKKKRVQAMSGRVCKRGYVILLAETGVISAGLTPKRDIDL